MREDQVLDLVLIQAKEKSDKYAKARVDSAQAERYSAHYNGFFAGYMMNIAKIESLEKQLIVYMKTKKVVEETLNDDIDDLLGVGYEDGDEDFLG